jgi:DNA-binding transcriptional ArsR family regulator
LQSYGDRVPQPPVRELGPEQLKALTHPLRVRLLKELRVHGPATATLLGRRLGESSGATSYHLRQLARHGFVEEDPDRGGARDRWWRAAFGGHYVDTARFLDDPEQRAVVTVYSAEVVATTAESAAEFVAEQHTWGREWADAADFSDFRLRLTPERLRALVDHLHAEIDAVEDVEGEGAEYVVVALQAYPRRIRPFTEEGS